AAGDQAVDEDHIDLLAVAARERAIRSSFQNGVARLVAAGRAARPDEQASHDRRNEPPLPSSHGSSRHPPPTGFAPPPIFGKPGRTPTTDAAYHGEIARNPQRVFRSGKLGEPRGYPTATALPVFTDSISR